MARVGFAGLGLGQTPVITTVPHQPAHTNNISPLYGTDDRLIFTSDLPRHSQRPLDPQLDAYALAPTILPPPGRPRSAGGPSPGCRPVRAWQRGSAVLRP
ncbi:MAG: hypothetical protein FJZ47_23205, partial [Candidatus Tectomicrobia bacterium]|nr:hypothetical protein [Candidatus Tectomicrobia bacterium]